MHKDEIRSYKTPASPPSEDIEILIVERALKSPNRIDLANGMAGVLLMQTRLYQMKPTAGRRNRINEILISILEHLETSGLHTGLWNGLTGILFALEFLRRVDKNLLSKDEKSIIIFVNEMDELLLDYVQKFSKGGRFDVICGLAGIGTYSLMRTDRTAAAKIFSSVENTLFTLADSDGSGCRWRTQAKHMQHTGNELQRRYGQYDLGVAHGTPGVIGMLSHGISLGLNTTKTHILLRDAIRWLRAQHNDNLKNSKFTHALIPGDSSLPKSSRLAWCYGDMGIISVLATSANVLADKDLQDYWRKLLEHRLLQPDSSFRLDSPGICHGDAGVLHMLSRLKRDFKSDNIEKHISILKNRQNTYVENYKNKLDNYALLDGASGVILALAETENIEINMYPWNLCLATSA